jgi:N-acetyl-anhydromuramyl-L-alanine amidase AmpD
MSNINQELGDIAWPGVVVDNADPLRTGRVRVRVQYVYGDIPTEDIPWASPKWLSPNGETFTVPDVGKVVSVEFNQGDIYSPEYSSAEHANKNLQSYLESISDDDYTSFSSVFFDGTTQVYKQRSKGLVLDNEKSNINIDQNGDMSMNLRDNKSVLNLGSADASAQAVVGTPFMEWLDTMVSVFEAGGFLGNLGAPVVPSPQMLSALAEYRSTRPTEFLSKNVWIVKNGQVQEQTRPGEDAQGDSWNSVSPTGNIKYTPAPLPPKYEPEKREEPEDRSADGDEDKNNILQRPVSVPQNTAKTTTRVNSSLQFVDLFLPESNYYKEEQKKSTFYLHHTAGGPNAEYVMASWRGRTDHVGTAFVIGGPTSKDSSMDGKVYRAFDEKYWANHLGVKKTAGVSTRTLHKTSIGVEVCNWGFLTQRNGKFYTYVNTEVNAADVYKLDAPFRGYTYWHKYSDAQIESLRRLLVYVRDKYGIPLDKRWTTASFDLDQRALKNTPGVWTHTNVRPDKFDIWPYPPLIQMLNSFAGAV